MKRLVEKILPGAVAFGVISGAILLSRCGSSTGPGTGGSSSSSTTSSSTSGSSGTTSTTTSSSSGGGNPSSSSFTVTTPGPTMFYQFADSTGTTLAGQNPTLILTHGQTYTFHMSAQSIHPMQILDGTTPYSGVTNNDIYSGDMTLAIPSVGYPSSLIYRCSIHGFGGDITIN